MIDEPQPADSQTEPEAPESAPPAEPTPEVAPAAPKAKNKPGPKPKAAKGAKAPKAAKPTPAPEVAPAAPSGAAYLDHDDPDASASFGGVEIVRGIEGFFLVPLHAIEELVAHGFRLIGGAE